MSGPFGSSQWMYASGGGFYPYEIEQSLRFNDNDSAYLSRTPASAGNRKTWTWSGWVKRGNLGTSRILGYHADSNNYFAFTFSSGDALFVQQRNGDGSTGFSATSSAVYRDPSAWYHVVLAVDTTQATNSNGVKIWVNGVQQSLSFGAYNQNADTYWNAALSHRIGEFNGSYLDGYMAEVNFIDGSALDPTSFGEFRSGIWVPKAYSGSYGTNGFYLPFSDSAAIGDDLSGNGNDWTPSGLASTDVMLDSPTNNYAVLSPLAKYLTNITTSDGNLTATKAAASTNDRIFGSIGVSSGQWYWEANVSALTGSGNYYLLLGVASGNVTGVVDPDYIAYIGTNDGVSGGNKIINTAGSAVNTAYGANYLAGDVLGVALDCDANTITFYKNGVSQGAITSIQDRLWFPFHFYDGSLNSGTTIYNFGQAPFAYTPPSGFLPLNTANLPAPAIDPAVDDVPADYFNTVLWTGDGTASRGITGVGFQPDFAWIKCRSSVSSFFHVLTDGVRGTNSQLFSNSTLAEETRTDRILSFDVDGFTVGNKNDVNNSGDTFVAWNWLAGNGTSSNTEGTITSTVSVNQKAGFSIVTGTAPASSVAFTTGHGLGVTPAMIITKVRSGTAYNWWTWHKALSNPAQSYLGLNLTNAAATDGTLWASTAPTSTVWSMTSGNYPTNSQPFVAYCFAEVEGFSKFGSYTGNGSTDGPFVYCGFRPAWLMVKRIDVANGWHMTDATRSPRNVIPDILYADQSAAEITNLSELDYLSNGFKIRVGSDRLNNSIGTYIFAAFAESPFKYSNAR